MEYKYQKNTAFYEDDDTHDAPDLAKGKLPLKTAGRIVADIFREYSEDWEDAEELSKTLEAFIDQLLSQSEISGSSDDWHNLAVDIAKKDYFGIACKVLDAGLARFSGSADLMGDYLQYGISCGKIDQCWNYYRQLCNMPRVKYSWRSFHFSVDWLIYLWECAEGQAEMDSLQAEMMSLVCDYRKYFPKSEDSYVCEADIYKLLKEETAEEKILQKAVKQSFPSPKCALRLADKYFTAGKYEKALEMIQKSIADSNQVQPSVNEAYLYYLSGLARISLRQESIDTDIQYIYSDFEKSLRLGMRRSFEESICQKVALLNHEGGREILENYSRLYELLDDCDML